MTNWRPEQMIFMGIPSFKKRAKWATYIENQQYLNKMTLSNDGSDR